LAILDSPQKKYEKISKNYNSWRESIFLVPVCMVAQAALFTRAHEIRQGSIAKAFQKVNRQAEIGVLLQFLTIHG